MSGTNDYQQFAAGSGANVETQTNYLADSTLVNGMASGIVPSNRLNKILRQATMGSAALGQIIANAGVNASDNGNVSTFVSNLISALNSELAFGNLDNMVTISGSTTITSAQCGNLFEFGGTGSYTTYVPLASGAGGSTLYFYNNSGFTQTIAIQGTDTGDYFFGPGIPGSSPTSISLANASSIMLVSDGFHWLAFAGSYIAGSMKGAYPIGSSGTTIDSHGFGNLIEFNNASAGSTTIPSAYQCNGAVLAFINNAAGAQTLNPVDHGFFFNGASGTSFTLPSGQSVRFISDGVNWCAFEGSWVVTQALASYETIAALTTTLAGYTQLSQAIGLSQSYYVVTSSRFVNTVYTNTGTKPMTVMISLTFSYNVAGTATAQAGPSGSLVNLLYSSYSTLSSLFPSFSFIVQSGQKYQLGTTGTLTINNWSEMS